jgi:hypothetical protein
MAGESFLNLRQPAARALLLRNYLPLSLRSVLRDCLMKEHSGRAGRCVSVNWHMEKHRDFGNGMGQR